ncbi:uncharacterized protein LOC113775693 [Coffea eugenioides]|uniref:uncharacterized protein LOC113775693 n=1 Tax=Coffea eugenioides TaxID=49369 RepID=UPI000F60CC06|nr:uncharacterized protein LOC113775693 [Coffea eugenioides]
MHNPCQIWHLDVPVEEDPSTLRENVCKNYYGALDSHWARSKVLLRLQQEVNRCVDGLARLGGKMEWHFVILDSYPHELPFALDEDLRGNFFPRNTCLACTWCFI